MTVLPEDPLSNGFVDISENRDRSVLKKILREGFGTVKPSPDNPNLDTVFVKYSSTYYGGEQDGQPYRYCSKRNSSYICFRTDDVVKPLKIGIPTMKPYEICELIVPKNFIFDGSPALKFTVELEKIEGAYDLNDYIITKRAPTSRYVCHGFEATIRYRQIRCDPVQDFQKITYTVGAPEQAGVPEAVDRCLYCLSEGEYCIIRDKGKSRVARPEVWSPEYFATYNDSKNHDSDKDVRYYEVGLVETTYSCMSINSLYNATMELSQAKFIKEKANEHFKNGRFSLAGNMYDVLSRALSRLCSRKRKNSKEHNQILIDVLLNSALCRLKCDDPYGCVEACEQVLDIDPDNEKALYRLGQAYKIRRNFSKAVESFEKLLSLNPGNEGVKQLLADCKLTDTQSEMKKEATLKAASDRLKQVICFEGDNRDV